MKSKRARYLCSSELDNCIYETPGEFHKEGLLMQVSIMLCPYKTGLSMALVAWVNLLTVPKK